MIFRYLRLANVNLTLSRRRPHLIHTRFQPGGPKVTNLLPTVSTVSLPPHVHHLPSEFFPCEYPQARPHGNSLERYSVVGVTSQSACVNRPVR
jgi:hypothetical protein